MCYSENKNGFNNNNQYYFDEEVRNYQSRPTHSLGQNDCLKRVTTEPTKSERSKNEGLIGKSINNSVFTKNLSVHFSNSKGINTFEYINDTISSQDSSMKSYEIVQSLKSKNYDTALKPLDSNTYERCDYNTGIKPYNHHRQNLMLDSTQKREIAVINQGFNELELQKMNLMDKLDSILYKDPSNQNTTIFEPKGKSVDYHSNILPANLITFDPFNSKNHQSCILENKDSYSTLDNSSIDVNGFIENVIKLFRNKKRSKLLRTVFQTWLKMYYENSIRLKAIEIEIKKNNNFN